MFTAWRETYRYGRETDPTDKTMKSFETAEKAIAYAERYAKGIKFVAAHIEDDETGKTIYEIVNWGTDRYDYRKEKK